MSKEIKVIDLLNKIANGEEVPETIIIYGDKYFYNREHCSIEGLYTHTGGAYWLGCADISLKTIIETIEEEPEIDIQNKKETNWEEIGKMVGKMYLEFAKGFNNALEQLGIELDNQINNK